MIRVLDLDWGYILINEVGQRFYELDHVTFSKNIFWSVNCTLFFYQIYSAQMSTLQLVERLAFLVRNCSPESISRKSHVTTFITLSIDAIYQAILNVSYQLTPFRETCI